MNNGMNKVLLLGNLGDDPELRHFETGAKLRFRLATSESWRDKKTGELKERTDWHTITLWGKRAEALARILTKGSRVMIEGRLETRSFEADGAKRYITEVNASELYFAGSPRFSQRDQEANAA